MASPELKVEVRVTLHNFTVKEALAQVSREVVNAPALAVFKVRLKEH